MNLPLHCESTALLEAGAEEAFAYLDDFKALSAHMERRSWMMLGSSMDISTDELGGRAVGSHVVMRGRVLGMRLRLEEIVTERGPPLRKAWQTVDTKLLVIGPYRLGFELSPHVEGSALRVTIDYQPPAWRLARPLGRLLARIYARWCTRRMALDASLRFARKFDKRQASSGR